ncbi:alpha/beta hydrolase [Algibacter pectinivorans]|uniref:Acetyl esterase/lipase n=1 Tax=Algibacter pectinivorans TaxID=870482 RepID=A0A1I1PNG3_9FLAO|nr:alpha/beta hydrolase [Algibacter pectinivorans]SFD11272.1 Acetyl esterase/lipase [Algibacter pectinivorans]
MKSYICLCFLFLIAFSTMAQNEILNLWETIPNHKHTAENEGVEIKDVKRVFLTKTPTIEVFLPSKRSLNGKAVLICPGGGYRYLAYDWEGTDVAKWLNSKGIAAFVLKSRLPLSKSLITPHEAPLQDAQRAIRLLRANADKWHINPNKIGVIGFSAGGHLASTLGTQFDAPNSFKEQSMDTISARPDFVALIYPVITMQDDFTHKGSQTNLLGSNPDDALKARFSNELQVTKDTPPTFLVHAGDDMVVPVENSLKLYNALKINGIKTEMHIYPYGSHGFGLAIGQGYLESWTNRFYDWLMEF